MTALPNPLAMAARTRPDHPALSCVRVLTYAQLADRVGRRAGEFSRAGVRAGHRVVLPGPFDLDWVVAFHAAGWLGAVAVVPPRDVPEGALADLLRDIEPDAVLGIGDATVPWRWLGRARDPFAAAVPPCEWDLDATRLGVFTSGSTGRNRCIWLSTGTLYFASMGSMIRLGHATDDRWALCLPLDHIGGLSILLRALWCATTVVWALPFSPERLNEALDCGDATMASLVPTMLRRLLDERGDRPFVPTVRSLLVGGAACEPALLDRSRALGAPVSVTWGMTEAGSQVATSFSDDPEGALQPLPFADVAEVAGRLHVSGPGFPVPLHTSDLGHVDDTGVHVRGRADAVVVSGGENIVPEAVEAALCAHPSIRTGVVVGVADADLGEAAVAVVELEGPDPVPEPTLRAWCRERLPSTHVPRRIFRVEALPTRGIGKVDRAVLTRRILAVGLNQPLSDECGLQVLGHRHGLERPEIDEGMDGLTTRVHHVAYLQNVGEAQGALAPGLDAEFDADAITHVDRRAEVARRMDQGHAPAFAEARVGLAQELGQELFERRVTVLEESPEKHDACAIDFVEAGRECVGKGHDRTPRLVDGGFPDAEP